MLKNSQSFYFCPLILQGPAICLNLFGRSKYVLSFLNYNFFYIIYFWYTVYWLILFSRAAPARLVLWTHMFKLTVRCITIWWEKKIPFFLNLTYPWRLKLWTGTYFCTNFKRWFFRNSKMFSCNMRHSLLPPTKTLPTKHIVWSGTFQTKGAKYLSFIHSGKTSTSTKYFTVWTKASISYSLSASVVNF